MFFQYLNKQRPAIVFVLSLLTASPALLAARPSPVSLDRVSVIINDDIITQSELKERMRAARNNLRQRKIALPPETALQSQVTDALILERLQLEHAMKLGIEISDTQIDEAISNLAKHNKLSRAKFLARAKRDKLDISLLKKDLRRQLIIRQLIDRVINRQIKVSEHEIDNYLADRARQGSGHEYNLSHILIRVPPDASASARGDAARRASEIRKKIVAGASFESLAIAHSNGPNALKGGTLGWRKTGQLPELFVKALAKGEKGTVTRVLESANGFHLLRINDKRGGISKTLVKQTRVRHILLKPTAIQSLKQARATLIKLRKRILAGEDFAELAKEYSVDPGSASQGGELGWIGPGELAARFEKAMNTLKTGEVSRPVQTQFGVHLIQVLQRRNKDVGEQRQRLGVRQQIFTRKAEERMQEWLQELRGQAYIEILSSN